MYVCMHVFLCEYIFFFLVFIAATNHTAPCWGRWGQGAESAALEGRSQKGGSEAVPGAVNQTLTHQVRTCIYTHTLKHVRT